MTAPLFPITRCSLSSIPALDFEFNSDCAVLPAPPPIFDQPDIEIPLDFPPQPVVIPPIETPRVCIPCPRIGASATLEFGDDSLTGADVTVTQLASAGSCDSSPDCEFMLDFNLRIPCADMSATAAVHWTHGSSESESPLPVVITRTPPAVPGAPCRYHFDFDFIALQTIINNIITNISFDPTPCLPRNIYATLTSDLSSGGTAGAISPTDGAILVSDANSFIPSGKKITSGAGVWLARDCDGGGDFVYSLMTANRCVS